jgi:hypothetical protein
MSTFRDDPPDLSASVIRDEQRPVRRLGYTDWSSVNFKGLLVGDEAGEDVFQWTDGLETSILPRNSTDPILQVPTRGFPNWSVSGHGAGLALFITALPAKTG